MENYHISINANHNFFKQEQFIFIHSVSKSAKTYEAWDNDECACGEPKLKKQRVEINSKF